MKPTRPQRRKLAYLILLPVILAPAAVGLLIIPSPQLSNNIGPIVLFTPLFSAIAAAVFLFNFAMTSDHYRQKRFPLSSTIAIAILFGIMCGILSATILIGACAWPFY